MGHQPLESTDGVSVRSGIIPASMERVYSVTPEMYGLGWLRLIGNALAGGIVLLLASYAFHGKLEPTFVDVVVFVALMFRERWMVPPMLRITADSIEEVNGKVIRKVEVKRVKECNRRWHSGLEIVDRRSSWFREYSIFVPAAVPEFDEIKGTVLGWGVAQE